MNWQYCDLKGRLSKIPTSFQVDEVGNIFQKLGGVKSKACQKCKKIFNASIKESNIIQPAPYYKCLECEFGNGGGDAALDHKLSTDHKLEKTTKDRLVGTKKEIIGLVPKIHISKDNVKILCADCYDSN